MRYWRFLSFSRYTQSETASTMKARDWKDVTDIVERERRYGNSSTKAYAA